MNAPAFRRITASASFCAAVCAAILASACTPQSAASESNVPIPAELHRPAAQAGLVYYNASGPKEVPGSEWRLELRHDTFEMTHASRSGNTGGAGGHPLTFHGIIKNRTPLTGGEDWLLSGRSGGQDITITINRGERGRCGAGGKAREAGRKHAQQDAVIVTFNGVLWSGCGG